MPCLMPYLNIHKIIFQNIFKYSQSTWYCVSETPPDFDFSSTFTWENWISVKSLDNFFYGNLNFQGKILPKLKIRECFRNAITRALLILKNI